MNIPFLDIIIPGQPRTPRVRPRIPDPTPEVVNAPADSAVPAPEAVKDSVVHADSIAQDSAARIHEFLTGGATGPDDNTILAWGIVVVFAALLFCLWFAYAYRRRLVAPRNSRYA